MMGGNKENLLLKRDANYAVIEALAHVTGALNALTESIVQLTKKLDEKKILTYNA